MVRTWASLVLASATLALSVFPTSCKSPDGLVQLDVRGDRSYPSVNLILTADGATTKTFRDVSFSQTATFQAGMYVPSSISGVVEIAAQVVGSVCGIGQVAVPSVTSGGTAAPVPLLIQAVDCSLLPGTGGASGGTGGMNGGSGGLSGGQGGGVGTGVGGIVGTGVGGVVGTGVGGVVGTGVGGVVGTGVGGVVGTGIGGSSGCGALIDDMEANSGFICTGNGRAGHWFTYIDSYAGSTITPSTAQVPALPSLITTPRTGSRYAMRAYGTYTSYAGIAALVNNPVINQTPGTFNASSYTGIRFTAMGSGGLQVVVQTSATESTTYGGTCNLASCYGATYLVTTSLSPTTWNTYSVSFTTLAANYGSAAFKSSDIWSIEFQPASTASYDIWIDDLMFY